MHTIACRKLLMLKPNEIHPSPNQPRRRFDSYELQRLADSIATSGVIQPISVRKNSNGIYELISGERRLHAARLAGLRRIPCLLHRIDDVTAAFYTVIENMQRSALTFFEEAETIKHLLEKYALTRTETAIRLGITQSMLIRKLSVLELSPELREKIVAAKLSEKQALLLLRLPENRREDAILKMISDGLNLKQSEELISVSLNPPSEKSSVQQSEPIRKIAIGDIRFFANSLYKLIDTVQSAGIDVKTNKNETEKYIEFKVRISKESLQTGYQQLKIC